MDISEVVDRHIDRLVSSISNGHVDSNSVRPVNSAITSWGDNNFMYSIIEEALLAWERAKKLPNGSELVEIAELRYQNALSSCKNMFARQPGGG